MTLVATEEICFFLGAASSGSSSPPSSKSASAPPSVLKFGAIVSNTNATRASVLSAKTSFRLLTASARERLDPKITDSAYLTAFNKLSYITRGFESMFGNSLEI